MDDVKAIVGGFKTPLCCFGNLKSIPRILSKNKISGSDTTKSVP